MEGRDSRTVVTYQRVLDEGFQECLAGAKAMHEQIKSRFSGRLEQLYSQDEELRRLISPWINNLYRAMVSTMFKVLRIIQPREFLSGAVNFYFLPGYHSCLIKRRLFYREQVVVGGKSTVQNFGIGLCGDPLNAPNNLTEYYDCSHARWYHYATTPPRPEKNFLPASPYHWFAYQQPRSSENILDLIASLTFSTVPHDRESDDFVEHKWLQLEPGYSYRWGEQVAEILNNMPYKRYPDWTFPDRVDRQLSTPQDLSREINLRYTRCLLISLWMHSAFEKERPRWWDMLMDELRKLQLTSVINSLSAANIDPIATDWGDQGCERPQFNTWTTVTMHPLVAPPPVPVWGPREGALTPYEASKTYRQTVGWATLLSSVPLGLPFISVVRPWIRMIYGMLRSAEVNVLLQDRLPLDRAAQAARLLSHDMYKFMEEPILTLIEEVEESTKDTIDYRRFILLSLKTQGEFVYAVCNAATDPVKVEALRSEILESLNRVGSDLVGCLYQVAKDVQHYRKEEDGGHVQLPDTFHYDIEIPVETYVNCLLLVGEIVRNHCRHGKSKVATLSIRQGLSNLIIEMEAPGPRRAGHSFGLLDNALETLRLGSAKFKNLAAKSIWTITIDIGGEEERS